MLKDYLKIKRFTIQICLASSIAVFLIWIIAYISYNGYDSYLSGDNWWNDYKSAFLGSYHTLLSDALSLATAIFFLWNNKKFGLKHNNYFIFYWLYIIAMDILQLSVNLGEAGTAYQVIPFTQFPLWYLNMKYLYQDILHTENSPWEQPIFRARVGAYCFRSLLNVSYIVMLMMDIEIPFLGTWTALSHSSNILTYILSFKYYDFLLKNCNNSFSNIQEMKIEKIDGEDENEQA